MVIDTYKSNQLNVFSVDCPLRTIISGLLLSRSCLWKMNSLLSFYKWVSYLRVLKIDFQFANCKSPTWGNLIIVLINKINLLAKLGLIHIIASIRKNMFIASGMDLTEWQRVEV